MLKELPRKGITMLMYLLNAIVKVQYQPKQLKIAKIILVYKPGKYPKDVCSYRPICLVLIIFKVLEKFLLHRIVPLINNIPDHQVWFLTTPLNPPTMAYRSHKQNPQKKRNITKSTEKFPISSLSNHVFHKEAVPYQSHSTYYTLRN